MAEAVIPKRRRYPRFELSAAFRRRHDFGSLLFIFVGLLPCAVALFYYGWFAQDRFVSEAQFIVRGVSKQQFSGLSILFRTFGIARSNDDSYAVHDYLRSRDAVREVETMLPLRDLYRVAEADYLSRFGTELTGDTFEDFYEYFQRRVRIIENLETGITTLRVTAFRPQDAKDVAQALMTVSEARVNRMNERARLDTLEFAERMLAEASDEVVRTQLDLTRFRNSELLISPEQVASGNLSVIASLTQQLVQEEVRLREMRNSSPSNPNISESERRVVSLQEQIDAERAKLTGSEDSLASLLGRYEELLLRRSMADRKYEAAVKGLDDARLEAARKQIYLEPLVAPGLPDKSTEPRRLRMIAAVMLISFVIFAMLYLLIAGSREHMNLD